MTRAAPVFPMRQAKALCRVGRLFGRRQWCLATSGNFSLRADPSHCLITQSGRDKSALTVDDLMLCDLDGRALDDSLKPSAETALHTGLYRHDAGVGAVLHTHSVTATVVSRAAGEALAFDGFEMQKAMRGVRTHDERLTLPVFDNSQDMAALTRMAIGRLESGSMTTAGFLVRGHGLYAWGEDLFEAQRHIEGLEFLLACLWQERLAKR